MSQTNIDELTELVIGAAYKVHNTLGSGFLESVYENALCLELDEAGLEVQQQCSIPVLYKNTSVGNFLADLVIENLLIVELKAVRELAKIHEVQLVNYLAATAIDNGLLINFGESVEVRRKFRRFIP